MASPFQSFGGTVEGVWIELVSPSSALQPQRRVYLEAEATPASRRILGEVHDAIDRKAPVVELGGVQNFRGTVEGEVVKANGLDAVEWLKRLDFVLENQENFSVWLVTPHFFHLNIAIPPGEVLVDPINAPEKRFRISLPYIDLST